MTYNVVLGTLNPTHSLNFTTSEVAADWHWL